MSFVSVGSTQPGMDVSPQALLRAGILRDIRQPEQAVARAQRWLNQGRFQEAYRVLQASCALHDGDIAPEAQQLIGTCLIYRGGDWHSALRGAAESFLEIGEVASAARCHRQLGEGFVMAGDFRLAEHHLMTARRLFDANHCGAAEIAEVLRHRARLDMKRGYILRAIDLLDESLDLYAESSDSAQHATAKVCTDRALALAYLGRDDASVRALLKASKIIARSQHWADFAWMRIVRSEALWMQGHASRAAETLNRLFAETQIAQNGPLRARIGLLLGRCYALTDPLKARQHLMRARHLYTSITADYGTVASELALAAVEKELGLNPMTRLRTLQSRLKNDWLTLKIEHSILAAEWLVPRDVNESKRLLIAARQMCSQIGLRWKIGAIDSLLKEHRLVQPDDLTPLSQLSTFDTAS